MSTTLTELLTRLNEMCYSSHRPYSQSALHIEVQEIRNDLEHFITSAGARARAADELNQFIEAHAPDQPARAYGHGLVRTAYGHLSGII